MNKKFLLLSITGLFVLSACVSDQQIMVTEYDDEEKNCSQLKFELSNLGVQFQDAKDDSRLPEDESAKVDDKVVDAKEGEDSLSDKVNNPDDDKLNDDEDVSMEEFMKLMKELEEEMKKNPDLKMDEAMKRLDEKLAGYGFAF